MKDDEEKVELTYGDVRRAAEKCPTAKSVLTDLVPKAFAPKEEWEDVTERLKFYTEWRDTGALIYIGVGVEGAVGMPWKLADNPHNWADQGRYKIENGRAYYRRA